MTAGLSSEQKAQQLTKEQKAHLYKELGIWEKGYTFGVVNLVLTLFVISRYPQYFWCMHLVKAAVLLSWRFYRFHQKGWEWYMIEFCYMNTYLTVVCCILTFLRTSFGIDNPLHPYNHLLIRIGFAFANGALFWAVLMFNNKLVFHDVDNTCSVYIHFSPALFFWILRWGAGFGVSFIEEAWKDMFYVCPNNYATDANLSTWALMLWQGSGSCAGSATHFILYPGAAWFILWAAPYSLLVFCLCADYIDRNKKKNVYIDTIESDSGAGKFITTNLPRRCWPVAHMMNHLVFTMACGAVSLVFWDSFILHTAALLAAFLFMVHNGSVFTFRVVAARHVTGLLENVMLSPVGSTERPEEA
eukprot:TRINITY_DN37583_c0_g1_i1.p1 TRINITY_DN37583_c0_g1~~TRINITY_DN37583_c0_g1_i1.p1  ORF type:complete len:358 (+),score=37.37 TRINITY_DN37583_c0_g1_i1:66-1139(+)